MKARALALALLLCACEGTGSAGDGLEIEEEQLDPRCTALGGTFPSGLALFPSDPDRAAAVAFQPPGVAILTLGGERPVLAARSDLPVSDTDLDGRDDGAVGMAILGTRFPVSPVVGELRAIDARTLLLSTGNYEQVLVADAAAGSLVTIQLETPGGFDPDLLPHFPAPGEATLRTAVSTFACILPPDPFDSRGEPIGVNSLCDATAPSFLTRTTAGKTLAAGHLFVATSNLRRSDPPAFYPGTLLVFEWDDAGATPRVRPSPTTPVILSGGFNPTGVARHLTPGGRELVLVTVTGAIGTGTGPGNPRSEAFVDVIDPVALRRVASIPLGFAGPFFDPPAVDPTGRMALLGSTSQRQLLAVDLRPLDDPDLYRPGQAPVLLDGLTPGFPDARIASADAPIALPDRPDGAPAFLCDGLTQVRWNHAGDQAFALDECDGTLTRLAVDLSGNPPVPLPAARIQVISQSELVAPTDRPGLPRSPGNLRVRPGVPGVDYSGADVLLSVGEPPPAQLCSVAIESS